MPKILCKCDHVLDLIISPAPDGFRVVSEKMVDSLYGTQVSSADEIVSKIALEGVMMFKCPACGRLIVFWDKSDPWPTFYQPEIKELREAGGDSVVRSA